MKKVLVVLSMDEGQRKLFEEHISGCEIIYSSCEVATKEMAEAADIIVGNIPVGLLKGCTHLELLQLNSAGTNSYASPGALPEGTKLCCASGAYGLSVAEYMVGEILAVKRRLYTYHDNQLQRIWREEGNVTSIYGSTAVAWGLGDIGSEFSRRMKAMGSHVIGIRRNRAARPDYVDEVYTVDEIDQVLGRADIVAMSLPGVPETFHLMNKERLLMLKKDAMVLNVGRGNAIDPQALLEVLEDGRLSSVVLDVTEPEPLPADSPLWNIERVHITPHISGKLYLSETVDRILRISAENVMNAVEGRHPGNLVDMETGYREFRGKGCMQI